MKIIVEVCKFIGYGGFRDILDDNKNFAETPKFII